MYPSVVNETVAEYNSLGGHLWALQVCRTWSFRDSTQMSDYYSKGSDFICSLVIFP